MSSDLCVATAWQILRDSTSKPSGLGVDRILLQELLPQDAATPGELPLVGVYLVDDQPLQHADGLSNRLVILQVEIRALIADGETALDATKALRRWALRLLLPNQQRETGIEGAEFLSFKPFGLAGQQRVAGALLEISIPFFFDPEDL